MLRESTDYPRLKRLPPTVNGEKTSTALKAILEKGPPYNAKISFQSDTKASGWVTLR
ncbi:hypothetical protein [Coxiella endosymbiont of Ornithodoros maritimus]|uniref:hypothetical protein n=1 Tax=Coxiella endosymbiont of Ornithodoros maritimus TaxID=1656172 RepID=UPI00226487A7|nr:hypothetical protein [Coxiella endosymbiont of Ornithodoros maritimus]